MRGELGCWHDAALKRADPSELLGARRREGLIYVLVCGDLGDKTLPYWGPVLLRVEIGSGVCFVGVTSISTRFGVSSRIVLCIAGT